MAVAGHGLGNSGGRKRTRIYCFHDRCRGKMIQSKKELFSSKRWNFSIRETGKSSAGLNSDEKFSVSNCSFSTISSAYSKWAQLSVLQDSGNGCPFQHAHISNFAFQTIVSQAKCIQLSISAPQKILMYIYETIYLSKNNGSDNESKSAQSRVCSTIGTAELFAHSFRERISQLSNFDRILFLFPLQDRVISIFFSRHSRPWATFSVEEWACSFGIIEFAAIF